jgi:hypothetical protein
MMVVCEHLRKEGHSEFGSNALFYIAATLFRSSLLKNDKLPCPVCKNGLLPLQMICHHFTVDSTVDLFAGHEDGDNHV